MSALERMRSYSFSMAKKKKISDVLANNLIKVGGDWNCLELSLSYTVHVHRLWNLLIMLELGELAFSSIHKELPIIWKTFLTFCDLNFTIYKVENKYSCPW